jgi:chromosome partitioning protein
LESKLAIFSTFSKWNNVSQEQTMYVISLANEKGGVAKTTSAISLAAILAEKNFRVLLMDLDPLACLTLSLGITLSENKPTMGEILLDHIPPSEAILRTKFENLDIIPAKSALGNTEKILPTSPDYIFTLRKKIETIYSNYDFVIIDCPPFMGALTLNALVASHLLLVPTQAEYFGIHGLRNLFDKVKIVHSGPNTFIKSKIFLTFYNERNKVNRMLKEHLSSRLSGNLLNSTITMDTKIRESQVCGVPINKYAPNSRGAKQYDELANEILNILIPA